MKFEEAIERVWNSEHIRRDKLRDLIGIAMALALDPLRGGAPAFLEAFRQKGMADLLKNWESNRLDVAVEPEQISWVFGGRLMEHIAKRIDLDATTVARCLVELVPALVNALHEQRHPTLENLNDEMRYYLRNFEGFGQGMPGLESVLRGELGIPGQQPTNTMQKLLHRLKALLNE